MMASFFLDEEPQTERRSQVQYKYLARTSTETEARRELEAMVTRANTMPVSSRPIFSRCFGDRIREIAVLPRRAAWKGCGSN
jgi:hypothetical protein